MSVIQEELKKLDKLTSSDFVLNYKGRGASIEDGNKENPSTLLLWPLPANAVITSKGRRIAGRDPNISTPTLKSLMISDSKYISESIRERLSTSTPEQIAEEEFLAFNGLGATHLSQCIQANLNQTLADLVAVYSDDRRLPFVVGALYIDAYMKCHKLFYYSFYPRDGYLMTEWKPKKVYIQPKTFLPPKKHDFKKYYRVNKPVTDEILPCPACGSPARLYRVGFRGKESQVCCTDPDEKCKWFMGAEKRSTEIEAIRSWNDMCLKHIAADKTSEVS